MVWVKLSACDETILKVENKGIWRPGKGLSWMRDKIPQILDVPCYTERLATLMTTYLSTQIGAGLGRVQVLFVHLRKLSPRRHAVRFDVDVRPVLPRRRPHYLLGPSTQPRCVYENFKII